MNITENMKTMCKWLFIESMPWPYFLSMILVSEMTVLIERNTVRTMSVTCQAFGCVIAIIGLCRNLMDLTGCTLFAEIKNWMDRCPFFAKGKQFISLESASFSVDGQVSAFKTTLRKESDFQNIEEQVIYLRSVIEGIGNKIEMYMTKNERAVAELERLVGGAKEEFKHEINAFRGKITQSLIGNYNLEMIGVLVTVYGLLLSSRV